MKALKQHKHVKVVLACQDDSRQKKKNDIKRNLQFALICDVLVDTSTRLNL